MRGAEPSRAPPPATDLGLFWRDAAACERELLSTFQSVPVLWNVADVEGETALASVGGPCTIGMGRGAGGGTGGTCATSGQSPPPPGLSPGILFMSHVSMHTDAKGCNPPPFLRKK